MFLRGGFFVLDVFWTFAVAAVSRRAWLLARVEE